MNPVKTVRKAKHGDTVTVREAIASAARRLINVGIEPSDAQTEARILAQFALGISREAVRMHPDRVVSPEAFTHFDALIARRARREPFAYLVGTREFYNLSFFVTPDVLIPRPETEFVVEAVLRHLANIPNARFADVGTGSGAIAVAVAANTPPGVLGFASDLSEAALAVACQNAQASGVTGRVTFAQGDLLAPLAAFAPFEVIASNPPYIAPQEIANLAPEVRFEPHMALGQNPDALHFYRRLAREAPPLLVPHGLLVVEVGQGQSEAVADLWRGAGLDDVTVTPDYAGIGRVVSSLCPPANV